ncbi:chaperonin containing TCP1 theta subunit [Heterostelium album PN500]|uniref:CCT-theta n=1 Tax=Heterostelium pallidum (strain ATCC 26659 / Pp 5 / PN500) TaxID=670386 RepID=D3B2K0_HETP5|nr:chaperonin containing TCP1 theta subunit [Heterostelium album PN500]EFA83548.1 chaperonin containing TCP1 theta subunit [Heterostelium album PN500]|eukprot:XP_020435665.1 chaperonin containing TCP1 theta subunit [Heterostelium album PN500]
MTNVTLSNHILLTKAKEKAAFRYFIPSSFLNKFDFQISTRSSSPIKSQIEHSTTFRYKEVEIDNRSYKFMMQLTDMLKDGAKHFSGRDEAILRNIEAAKQLAEITRTSMGPNGMNKMIINHLEKLFVTNDAATIIKQLDVVHPAAKMLVLAAQMQEQEMGDGTNLVVTLAGEFLQKAAALLEMGLHSSEIIFGYDRAGEKVQSIIESLIVHTLTDVRNIDEVKKGLKSALASKQYGYETFLSDIIAKACIQVLPKKPSNFNVDNVRVTKIPGGGVTDTSVFKGLVVAGDAEGAIKRVEKGKIAVFASGIDIGKTETTGKVLITNDTELLNFSKGEEDSIRETIQGIADAGVKIIVSGSSVSEIALHYIERYGMMLVKLPSKFQLRRLCKTVGSTPLVKLGAPIPEELGYCDEVYVEEIGSTKCVIFRQTREDSEISSIVVRGSTNNILDDIERAIDDGVNVFKGMCKDGRFLAGAGAFELEVSRQLQQFADATPGLAQYAIRAYAEAFEIIPRTLAETSGHDATKIISNIYAAHTKGNTDFGLDIETGNAKSAKEMEIFDLFIGKQYAIKLATNTATTVLRVDQIIMSKPAGGPKAPKQNSGDGDPDF